jgi:hypothetical protein
MMSMLYNCCVRELLILARTWFAFGLSSKTGCDRRKNEEHEETLGTTMEVLTGEEHPRRSREEIHRLPEIWGSNR